MGLGANAVSESVSRATADHPLPLYYGLNPTTTWSGPGDVYFPPEYEGVSLESLEKPRASGEPPVSTFRIGDRSWAIFRRIDSYPEIGDAHVYFGLTDLAHPNFGFFPIAYEAIKIVMLKGRAWAIASARPGGVMTQHVVDLTAKTPKVVVEIATKSYVFSTPKFSHVISSGDRLWLIVEDTKYNRAWRVWETAAYAIYDLTDNGAKLFEGLWYEPRDMYALDGQVWWTGSRRWTSGSREWGLFNLSSPNEPILHTEHNERSEITLDRKGKEVVVRVGGKKKMTLGPSEPLHIAEGLSDNQHWSTQEKPIILGQPLVTQGPPVTTADPIDVMPPDSSATASTDLTMGEDPAIWTTGGSIQGAHTFATYAPAAVAHHAAFRSPVMLMGL